MAEPTDSAPAAGVKGEVTVVEPTRAERAVIRRSAEARATVPDVELEIEISVDRVIDRGGEASVEAVVLAACARAMRVHPRLNGAYRDGHYELHGRVNAGIVLAELDTYPVATVFDADERSVNELQADLGRLRERAASGELSAPELSGATFSFWYAGTSGISRAALPVIPPHAAALVAGAVRALPSARDGDIVPGHGMTLTLVCDHRIAFGRHATDFLSEVRTCLEEEQEDQ